MADLKTFAEQLVNLSVKEVSELADILKNEYGIEPAATAVQRLQQQVAQQAEMQLKKNQNLMLFLRQQEVQN